MKCKDNYADMNKYKAYRNRYKKKYYAKSQANATNRRSEYTSKEIEMILDHSMTDQELSKIIGRSVKAIQIKRCRLLGHDAETERRKNMQHNRHKEREGMKNGVSVKRG